MSPDVLVIGAGPTGLLLAAELSRRGVDVRVVEKRTAPSAESRALAVFPRTLEVWERAGAVEEALALGRRLDGARLHGRDRALGRVRFDSLDSAYRFALCLPQGDTERILERLATRRGASIDRGVELIGLEQDSDGVRASLRRGDGSEEEAQAAWLVGCDGARGVVREQVGLDFAGRDIDTPFVLADLRAEWDLSDDTLHAFFAADGPFAAIPLPEGGRWRLVAGLRSHAEPPNEPGIDVFRELAARRCGVPVELSEPGWMASFRIRQRRVERYRSGRAWLAGDAAHAHSPVGGQGMNAGQQDAFNLAWKLALAVRGRARTPLLDSYGAEREPVGRRLLLGTEIATRVVTLRSRHLQALRDVVLRAVLATKSAPRRVARTLSELGIRYTQGAAVAGRRPTRPRRHERAGPRPGERVPHLGRLPADLRAALDAGRLALVVFGRASSGDDPGTASAPASGREWIPEPLADLVDVRHVPVRGPGAAASPEERELESLLAGAPGELVLLRPDGRVAFRGGSDEGKELRRFLGRLLREA